MDSDNKFWLSLAAMFIGGVLGVVFLTTSYYSNNQRYYIEGGYEEVQLFPGTMNAATTWRKVHKSKAELEAEAKGVQLEKDKPTTSPPP